MTKIKKLDPHKIYNIKELSKIIRVSEEEVEDAIKKKNGIIARSFHGDYRILGLSVINFFTDWLHHD